MKYNKIFKGKFIERPNRFIARVEINGKNEIVHVKNTGRCRELFIPECTVYLSEAANPERKTKYDLIAVEKERDGNLPLLINVDSQIPNDAAEEWLKKCRLFPESSVIRREVKHGASRFDFCIEYENKRAFLEVKGVTLEDNGTALFPDAPTERGIKHIMELIDCVNEGIDAYILFVIQMKGISVFRPNDVTHPQFGDALSRAQKAGVNIIAVDCIITPDSIEIDMPVRTELDSRR